MECSKLVLIRTSLAQRNVVIGAPFGLFINFNTMAGFNTFINPYRLSKLAYFGIVTYGINYIYDR